MQKPIDAEIQQIINVFGHNIDAIIKTVMMCGLSIHYETILSVGICVILDFFTILNDCLFLVLFFVLSLLTVSDHQTNLKDKFKHKNKTIWTGILHYL